eukprot:355276-Chlamydomonas_euryale.AAC.3
MAPTHLRCAFDRSRHHGTRCRGGPSPPATSKNGSYQYLPLVSSIIPLFHASPSWLRPHSLAWIPPPWLSERSTAPAPQQVRSLFSKCVQLHSAHIVPLSTPPLPPHTYPSHGLAHVVTSDAQRPPRIKGQCC